MFIIYWNTALETTNEKLFPMDFHLKYILPYPRVLINVQRDDYTLIKADVHFVNRIFEGLLHLMSKIPTKSK